MWRKLVLLKLRSSKLRRFELYFEIYILISSLNQFDSKSDHIFIISDKLK